ncbi:MAG: DNA polymerase IV [Candidatus Andersenbacteria bacterium]|nr:DNA polymerase IV [Candidatus Andersenbacteria bacterium]
MQKRIVAHFDMDAFFAAIEERDNPRFRGMPIVVGADPQRGSGRGVVSTANYAARAFGIGSAMPITRAWKLAQLAQQRGEPATIFLPGSWRRYNESSDRIMAIVKKLTPMMQQRSVDEAYADISHVGSTEAATALARKIKEEIAATEKLTCSVGIGPNKLVAKIASDFDKPDGFTIVDESAVEQFLAPLPVRAIPGIGPKTEERLKEIGVATIKDLYRQSENDLIEKFGSWGEELYRKARGLDDRPVMEEYVRKSIGEQQTFPKDVSDAGVVIQTMSEVVRSVFSLLQDKGYTGARTVVITVRFHDFETISSMHTVKETMVDSLTVEREAIRLLLPFLDMRRNPKKKPLRLVGVRLEKLE